MARKPETLDGRAVVVTSPATEGWRTWFTSAGDNANPTPPASGRGDGIRLKFDFDGAQAETKTVDLKFNEPTEIHDGEFWYTPVANWSIDDSFTLSVAIPATVVTLASPVNTGNCNLTDMGGYNLITPAVGDGTHDVDLALAAPVPADDAGYWDADHKTGIVTASGIPGKAKWHLLDIGTESFFIKPVIMGNPLGIFAIDAYKAEWISERWALRVSITKNGLSVGKCGGWLMMFREKST